MRSNLKRSVSQLIPVDFREIDNQDTQTVNARDVYKFLEVREDFSDWIKRSIKRYEFVEGEEYVRSRNIGSEHRIEYFVTLDMAKELCMVQNNPKGKEARQYFIQCEKEYRRLALREAKRAEKRAQIEWQEARNQGKFVRRQETDAIEEYCEYAKSCGSHAAKKNHYSNFTGMANKVLFGVKKGKCKGNLREYLNLAQLAHLMVSDDLISKELRKRIESGEEYHEIYQSVKNKVQAYADLVTPELVLLENVDILILPKVKP